MSQHEVPLGNNDVPFSNDVIAAGAADPAGYAPQSAAPAYPNQGGNGGYPPPPQGSAGYKRNTVPMIDPIESAKLTPQVLILLVLSGLRRHWKWSIPMGLIFGLLAAGTLYLAFPLQYEARAFLRIRSSKPRFIFTDQQQVKYDEFVNTQLALIRNPDILNKALENPDVAKLPCVLKEKDKKGWLVKKLRMKPDGKSEIIIISIETDAEDASEKIVNSVLEAYMDYNSVAASDNEQKLLTQLTAEFQRQNRSAEFLQSQIRNKTEMATAQGAAATLEGMGAGMNQGQSLERDVFLADAQLTAMRAKRKGLQERLDNPNQIPRSILINAMQQDPELQRINAVLEEKKTRKDMLKETLKKPDDPRFLQLDREIADLEKQMQQMLSMGEGSKGNEIATMLKFQVEQDMYVLDQDIRTQEILVEELTKKHAEQLTKSSTRSVNVVDVSFDKDQLLRTNKVLDALSERMVTLQAERHAPDQISLQTKAVTTSPSKKKQVIIIGMGAAMFAFFPIGLSIVIERLKPRLYHVSQVRRAVPNVLIGEIMEPPVSWLHGATFRKRMARYRESVHNWCTHLLLSDPFRSCRTLAVASVAGDDGKTFLAVQIAVAMAQMKSGSVLLIDGDMRVGRLHLLFGNEETGLGLADVLSFRKGFGEAVVMNEKEPNLHLLSAGQLDVTPYELLGDGRFREMLDMLEQSYSLILVVLPPVANAAESLIMASSTDSTLLCVRQGETVLAAMEDVFCKLVNTGSSVDGIVVKDIPYYQMAGKDGGFADKLEQIRLSHLLQYAD